MKRILFLFILVFFAFSCGRNKNIKQHDSNEGSIPEFHGQKDTLVSVGIDTLALFYGVNQKVIIVKAKLINKVIFNKTLRVNDFISDAPYKDVSYFDKVYYTGYVLDTKELVFTTYLKRIDKPKFLLEGTFTLDLKGNFNLVTD